MDSEQNRLVAGRYRLLSPLGSGGMGTVWRARDEVLGRAVAVKEVIFPQGLSDEDREVLRERTRREARAAARLDHPSAVTVYDVVEEDGAPYLVMELVEARTLSQVVRSDGPLSPSRTAEVGIALLGALETAHRQGIVHRDVKPGNVLLCSDSTGGRVVLTDFGIASSVGDSSITSTGLLLGSPSYIAPERARGQAPAPASDLWSLGATLFTAVEGKPPFDGGEPLLTVTAVVTGEHEPFVAAGPLEPVLEGLLERDPDQRLSAAAARAALAPLVSSASRAATAPPATEDEKRTERTTALPMRDVQAAAAAPPAPEPEPDPQPVARAAVDPEPEPWTRPPRVLPEPRRSRRSRTPLVLLVLLLLSAALVVGVLLSDRTPAEDVRLPGQAEPETSAEPDDEDQMDEGDEEPAALPEGWTRYESDQGWSIGVPPTYAQSVRNGQIQFRNDDTRRTLRIRSGPGGDGDPVQVARAYSDALAGQLGDYRQILVQPVDDADLPAADLEFTYFDGTSLRVVDRTLLDESGEYHLYWQVNAGDWDDALPLFRQIADTFEPAGSTPSG